MSCTTFICKLSTDLITNLVHLHIKHESDVDDLTSIHSVLGFDTVNCGVGKSSTLPFDDHTIEKLEG